MADEPDIIELPDEDFSFLMMNLLGHDPIHDFKFASRLYEKHYIIEKIYQIYQLIKNKYRKFITPSELLAYQRKALSPLKGGGIINQTKVDIDDELNNLIMNNSLFILYLVGFLNNNDFKKMDFNKNIPDDIKYKYIEYYIIYIACEKYLEEYLNSKKNDVENTEEISSEINETDLKEKSPLYSLSSLSSALPIVKPIAHLPSTISVASGGIKKRKSKKIRKKSRTFRKKKNYKKTKEKIHKKK